MVFPVFGFLPALIFCHFLLVFFHLPVLIFCYFLLIFFHLPVLIFFPSSSADILPFFADILSSSSADICHFLLIFFHLPVLIFCHFLLIFFPSSSADNLPSFADILPSSSADILPSSRARITSILLFFRIYALQIRILLTAYQNSNMNPLNGTCKSTMLSRKYSFSSLVSDYALDFFLHRFFFIIPLPKYKLYPTNKETFLLALSKKVPRRHYPIL